MSSPDRDEMTAPIATHEPSAHDTARFERVVAEARSARARREYLVWVWSGGLAIALVALLLYAQQQQAELRRESELQNARLSAAADSQRVRAEVQIQRARASAESALGQSAAQQTVIRAMSAQLQERFADRDTLEHLRQLRRGDSVDIATLRATVARISEADAQRTQRLARLSDEFGSLTTRVAAVSETVRVQRRDIASARQQSEATGRRVELLDRRVGAKADTTMVNARIRVLHDSLNRIRPNALDAAARLRRPPTEPPNEPPD